MHPRLAPRVVRLTTARTILVVLCSSLLAACGAGQDSTTNPLNGSVSLTISSTDAMTSAGDTRTVTAAVRDGTGAITSSPTLAWTTSDPAVATVTGTGATATVTAVRDGTAIIGASAGSSQSSVTVTVHRRLASVQVSAPAPVLTLGASMQMEAIALDARGHELTTITSFIWASSSAAVPLFNTTGLITALFTLNGPQTAVITATATLDGVTASGFTPVTEAVPQGFDFAALMLTEYELPTRPLNAW